MKKARYAEQIARHTGLTLLKKHSAGLTAMTEKSLADKAGHLELLRGGKKENRAEKGGGKLPKKAK